MLAASSPFNSQHIDSPRTHSLPTPPFLASMHPTLHTSPQLDPRHTLPLSLIPSVHFYTQNTILSLMSTSIISSTLLSHRPSTWPTSHICCSHYNKIICFFTCSCLFFDIRTRSTNLSSYLPSCGDPSTVQYGCSLTFNPHALQTSVSFLPAVHSSTRCPSSPQRKHRPGKSPST